MKGQGDREKRSICIRVCRIKSRSSSSIHHKDLQPSSQSMASGMYHVLSYLHEFNSLEMYMILDPWLLFRIKSLLFPTSCASQYHMWPPWARRDMHSCMVSCIYGLFVFFKPKRERAESEVESLWLLRSFTTPLSTRGIKRAPDATWLCACCGYELKREHEWHLYYFKGAYYTRYQQLNYVILDIHYKFKSKVWNIV